MRIRSLMGMMLVAAMFIAGCSQERLLKALVTPEEEQAAQHYIALLRAQKTDQIEQDIDPALKAKSPKLHQTLLNMAAQMPAEAPLSIKLVGASSFTSSTLHKSDITYEYRYAHLRMLVNVAVQKKDGASTIIGLNVRKFPDAPETDRFSLSGKSPLQYSVLALGAISLAFSLYALVLCIRTKMPRRKWLWIIFILIGVGSLSVNWATGQWNFQLMSVQLLSASASAPPYGGWVITISVPLGAILFLMRRKELAQAAGE